MKIKRQFDWEGLIGDQAWTAHELRAKIGMNIMTFRRYLRFAVLGRILIELRLGRYKYYTTKSALTRHFLPDMKDKCHLSLCKECDSKICQDVLKTKELFRESL